LILPRPSLAEALTRSGIDRHVWRQGAAIRGKV
jgi:hypothetical protein